MASVPTSQDWRLENAVKMDFKGVVISNGIKNGKEGNASVHEPTNEDND